MVRKISPPMFWLILGMAILPGLISAMAFIGTLQQQYMPIVTDFEVEKIWRTPENDVVASGRLVRHHSSFCKYRNVVWYARQSGEVSRRIEWFALDMPRDGRSLPDGVHLWGDWKFLVGKYPETVSVYGVADYVCFGIFLTEGALGPIYLPDRRPDA